MRYDLSTTDGKRKFIADHSEGIEYVFYAAKDSWKDLQSQELAYSISDLVDTDMDHAVNDQVSIEERVVARILLTEIYQKKHAEWLEEIQPA